MARPKPRSGRFSKHGAGDSDQDKVGKQIYTNAADLLSNRALLLSPLKFEDPYEELFRYAFTEPQWQAWQIMEKHDQLRGALRYVNTIHIYRNRAKEHFEIPAPEPVPYFTIDWDWLPLATQDKLYRWQLKATSLEHEKEVILAHIKALCQECTSPGQLKRVWPELLGFMPTRSKTRVFRAKARSPYPKGVLLYELAKDGRSEKCVGLVDQWKPEALEWMNTIFAEALILPDIGGGPFPSYNGDA